MKYLKVILVMGLLIGAALFSGCTGSGDASPAGDTNAINETPTLTVYCGAGLREPMEDIAELFEAESGTEIRYNFAGSNTLLSQMELTEIGDVYMPGATYYFDVARDKGYTDKEELIAYHVPVIITPKDNPANITCLADLAKPGVKLEFGDPKACAIGKLSNKIFEKNGIKEEVNANVVSRGATVNEVLLDTNLGTVDASIVWEDLCDSETLNVIRIPKEQNIFKVVPISTLTFSEHRDAAESFVSFVASEKGKNVFKAHGFVTYPDPYYEN